MDLSKYIDDVADFPQKGVIFKDITRLLRENFTELLDALSEKIDWTDIDCIAGIDARGFILGAGLAAKQGLGFIPIRKKGKLPPPTIAHSYELEYGTDTLEIKDDKSNKKLLVIDDVLATGGTLKAALTLCEKAGHTVKDTIVMIDLKFLNNFEQEGIPVKSLMEIK